MDDATRLAMLDELIEYNGTPRRKKGFTLLEYRKRHRVKYGYDIPESTARDRLAVLVEKGIAGTAERYVSTGDEEGDRRVWWLLDKEE